MNRRTDWPAGAGL